MEVWKCIEGYESIYQVSDLGRVRSLDRFCKNRKGSGKQTGRILKQQISKKGYLMVCLSVDNKRFHTGVHRLVAIAFIDNHETKPQVNHINGIKTDNRVENLEWCTNKENQIHAIKNKLIKHNYSEKHHMSKMSNDQVRTARRMHELGWSNKILANHYEITPTAMSNILRNKTYINI